MIEGASLKWIKIAGAAVGTVAVIAFLAGSSEPLTDYKTEAARLARLKPEHVTCVEGSGFWGIACKSSPPGFELAVKISDEMKAYDADCEQANRGDCLALLDKLLLDFGTTREGLEGCDKSVGRLIEKRSGSFLIQCGLGPDGGKLSFKIWRQRSF